MKNCKRLAALALLLCLLTACSGETVSPSPSVLPPGVTNPPVMGDVSLPPQSTAAFGTEDLIVGSVAYGASRAEVEAALGTPDEVAEAEDESGVPRTLLMYLDGMTMFLSQDDRLVGASVAIAGIDGPRGLVVGDPLEKVTRSFRNDGTGDDLLYSAGRLDKPFGELPCLPPCGYLSSVDSARYVHYAVPMTPYDGDAKAQLSTVEHATLTFAFQEDALVGFFWNTGKLTA